MIIKPSDSPYMDFDDVGPPYKDHIALRYDHHLYQVLSDQEFRKDVISLNDKHAELAASSEEVYRNGISKFPEAYNKEAIREWKEISDKYSITQQAIDIFLHGYYHVKDWPAGGYVDLMESSADSIILKLDPSITYKEYVALWKEVQSDKQVEKNTKRRRNPEYPGLIYAVFKARASLTFREIFELYTSGNLPLYHGSLSQFGDEDSLERYYNKYKPLGQPDT